MNPQGSRRMGGTTPRIGPVTSMLQMLGSKEKQSIDHVEPDGCEEGKPWTMIGRRTVGPRLKSFGRSRILVGSVGTCVCLNEYCGGFGDNRGYVGIIEDGNAEAAFRKAGSIAPSELQSADAIMPMKRNAGRPVGGRSL